MVTVAADEGSARECTERCALVLAFLLDHERLAEDTSVILLLHNRLDRQLSLRSIDHCLIDEDDVIDIPCAPVCK